MKHATTTHAGGRGVFVVSQRTNGMQLNTPPWHAIAAWVAVAWPLWGCMSVEFEYPGSR
ncbi:MAG: hypothetical protein R3C12_05280 [Planctomycetaceae bacterium]